MTIKIPKITADYRYYVVALGINMMWNPYPIVGFLRDGLGIGPSGMIFTALFLVGGLLLVVPAAIFKRVYQPNLPLLVLGSTFVALCIVYLQYYPNSAFNYYQHRYREWSYWGNVILFMFGLLYFPNDQTDKILLVTVAYATLASLGLAFALARDPDWQVGARAGISFRNTAGSTTNPHVYAYSAVAGFIGALVQISYTRVSLIRWACVGAIFLHIGVVMICRSASGILALAMIMVVYAVVNYSRILRTLRKPRMLMYMGVAFAMMAIYIARHRVYLDVAVMYGEVILKRYTTMVMASTGATKTQDLDMSSKGRVVSFQLAVDRMNKATPLELVFGDGYKRYFLDIPILESLLNYGIIGFLIYAAFLLLLYFNCAIQILRPTNAYCLFLAYYIAVTVVTQFFNGRPTDPSSWLLFAIYIRFMGIYYPKTTTELRVNAAK